MIYLLQSVCGDTIPFNDSCAENVIMELFENITSDCNEDNPDWEYILDCSKICIVKDIDVLRENASKLELTLREIENIEASIKFEDEFFYLICTESDSSKLAKMLEEWYNKSQTYLDDNFAIEIIRKNEKSIYNTWYDIYGDSRPGYPDKNIDQDDIENYENLPNGISVYEIGGPLFFASAKQYAELIQESGISSKILIIRMRHVSFIDSTALHNLHETIKTLKENGTLILTSGTNNTVFKDLYKHNIVSLIEEKNMILIHLTKRSALMKLKTTTIQI